MKPNKFTNLFIAIIFGFSATLNASILPNSQILQSNLNSLSIPQTNKSIKGSKFNSNSNTITNKASNLKANNINLSNKKDTTITGSNLLANNDININTNNLFINASQDSYNYNDKTKELSGSIDYTIYGGGGGTLGLNYSQSHSDQENLINNNSQIIVNNDININTTNDTTIKGANLRADNALNLNTNNLTLESLRDKYQANSKSSSIGVGIGFSQGHNSGSNFTNGSMQTSSANANYGKSSSNSIIKQTNLSSITANEVNINAKGNTHLKGSMIAAGNYDENGKFSDNGNLNLTTNSLTFENLSNTNYSKGKSFAISANMGLNQQEVTKFTQDDYRPQNMQNTLNTAKQEKANSLNNPSVSNISLGTSNSVSFGKTLATIGNGNLQISNLDDSDDLDRLNRNVDNIQKDIVNSQTSTYAQADIDNRLFTENGRESIKHDLLIMSDLLSNGMPKENSTNPIEANIGKTLNFLGDITLGIIPSNENKGGILGQLGATIVADPNFVILNDNSGSNNVFIPGIMTKEENAKDQAYYYMTNNDYKVYYNPTRGIIADLTESAVDFLGGTSGIAKQTGYEMKNNPNNNYVALSQGSLIANSGINYYGLNENIVYIGTPLYTKPNNGITVNSKNDVIHDPTNLFNIPLYKNGQIFYEHIWSNDYKGIINKIKENGAK